MGAQKLVVFHPPEIQPGALSQSLSELEGSISLPLPDANKSLADADYADVVKQHDPQAILFEVVDGYDYHEFIDQLASLYTDDKPALLGILDDSSQPSNLLTKWPLDSYIGSDWDLDRTLSKLGSFVRLKEHNEELKKQVENTTNTAMTAMKAASEIGLLMQLVEWLRSASTQTDVANCIFRMCSNLGLKSYVLVLDNDEHRFFPEGAVHESAKKILDEALETDIRVLSKDRILVFRLDYLVMMVTNAPWDDQEKYGRLRDILLQGAALAESKARTITVNNLIVNQHSQVTSIMDMIKSVSAETQMYTREIMKNLSDELQMAAMGLDLTEEQEQKLIELSNEAFDALDVLYKSSDALEQHFHSLISSITAVAELTKNSVADSEPEPATDDDVELF